MKIFEKQVWHLLILLLLIVAIFFYVQNDAGLTSGNLWNVETTTWLIVAVAIPILHQIYVLLCWRYELHYKSLSNRFGDNTFKIYKIGFFILFVSRMLFLITLSLSNSNTFDIPPFYKYTLIAIISFLVIYAFYSVVRFFGMDRAAGLDHFDSSIAKLPFIKQGIFKYTNNGMYKYAFLAFYLPGIIWESRASVMVALFSHLYIWVHYYFTELPDIKTIYSNSKE